MTNEQTKHRQYLSVRREGGSRVIALTPFIPKDWKIVKVQQVRNQYTEEDQAVLLNIVKVA